MPSRRRKTTTPKMTAQAAPDVEVSRPPVTQVVEVIDEEVPIAEPDVAAATPEKEVEPEPTVASETRKEKVEELYQQEKETTMMPEISVHKSKPLASLVVWALVTICVALLTGGILFSLAKKTSPLKLFARPTPTPTATPTPTPTPTPPSIDKTSFEIKVLNGGGTPGAAGKMKTFLEDKGYTVSGTGNTQEYIYTTTEIHGKVAMMDAIANLQADLKDTYTIGTVAADLSASSSAAVEVIVGK